MRKSDVLDQKIITDFKDPGLARDAVLLFCNSDLHYDTDNRYETEFYGRRLRPHLVKYLDFNNPVTVHSLPEYASFSANRILYSMHESEFLLLPQESMLIEKDFSLFYQREKASAAAIAIPYLEYYLFDFLHKEVQVSDNWTLERVSEYFSNFAYRSSKVDSTRSSDAILQANDPQNAAKDWLLQLSPDFLIESSPMARYASGSFGPLGSNLFRIIIDELGYGVFEKKHATLFEKSLNSVGLDSTPHKYWQYYLNGSLTLANYFNMLTRNKRNIFKYIGAIYLAETEFINTCKVWRDTFKKTFPEMDVRYFEEHIHIDKNHSRIAFDSLVKPAIEQYGTLAANEIIQGFEEARWLGEFAENDFVSQIEWKNNAVRNQEKHNNLFSKVVSAYHSGEISMDTFIEPKGELSVTHSHDEDELCHIVSGTMEYLNGFELSSKLEAGSGIVINKNRLHGALIESEQCEYQIYNIKDAQKWL